MKNPVKKKKVNLRPEKLERPGMGQYWNISVESVLFDSGLYPWSRTG